MSRDIARKPLLPCVNKLHGCEERSQVYTYTGTYVSSTVLTNRAIRIPPQLDPLILPSKFPNPTHMMPSTQSKPVTLPRIAITYCTQCRWMLRAAYVRPPTTHSLPLPLPPRVSAPKSSIRPNLPN